MLKEVMLGSGGIMLAAVIFASSMTPGTAPVADVPAEPVAAVAPAPPARVLTAPRPAPIFPEESGDLTFGAPMIEAVPVESGTADPELSTAIPGSAEAQGGRQFYARPGRPYPTPR
ncbi:hypothetical protein [Blastomonas sp.]|uniref:hypothetical protein n=1 Tax=Blastomonas sp. TaxID=1909299 RepID=UPI00260E1CAB|nr:hypothetical protein [Blastomonas sp.]MDM7955336.1 hypothetical protein [Blastomonas sp.]